MIRSIWWMKRWGNLPPRHYALLFSISGTGSFICPVAQTRLDIPRPFFTQSWTTGGKVKVLQHKADSKRRPVGPQWNTLSTRPRWPPKSVGDLLPIGGIVVRTYVCVCVCVCMYVCMYVPTPQSYIYVYMYMYVLCICYFSPPTVYNHLP